MSAFPAGYSFHLLTQVDSTNMYAMELVYAGLAGNGAVFFTNYQSKGKGQRGKEWISAPGESILMSIVLDTNRLTPSQSFRLSAAIALAVKDFIEFVTGAEICIKWPNDLYSGDRKAGGILIENIIKDGMLRWSVVGIGINVNQLKFPENLPNPVSLRMITGQVYDSQALAKQVAGFAERRWQQLLSGGWNEMISDYNKALFGLGQVKKLKKGSVVIPCKIKGVSHQGILVAGENDEWHFAHGEVEWLMPNP
ncbi:biotin--[acetyl-CoA-carboxylase] ligase [soil metagenome]